MTRSRLLIVLGFPQYLPLCLSKEPGWRRFGLPTGTKNAAGSMTLLPLLPRRLAVPSTGLLPTNGTPKSFSKLVPKLLFRRRLRSGTPLCTLDIDALPVQDRACCADQGPTVLVHFGVRRPQTPLTFARQSNAATSLPSRRQINQLSIGDHGEETRRRFPAPDDFRSRGSVCGATSLAAACPSRAGRPFGINLRCGQSEIDDESSARQKV